MFLHKIPGSCIELDVDGIGLRLNDADEVLYDFAVAFVLHFVSLTWDGF